MYTHIWGYIIIIVYIYIYICIFVRQDPPHLRCWEPLGRTLRDSLDTVGFHNFNLRIFNLRVSNPNELIVDAFLTRCRISMCQGLGPKKHDEISEIDRIFGISTGLARSACSAYAQLQPIVWARGIELANYI